MDSQQREELERLRSEQGRLQDELSGLNDRLRELEVRWHGQAAEDEQAKLPIAGLGQPPLQKRTPPPVPAAAMKMAKEPRTSEASASPWQGERAPADDKGERAPADDKGVQASNWELNLGKVWFVRLGVGLVLTGLVFLSLYAYKNWIFNATAAVKVSFFFAVSLSMVAGGYVIERGREHLRQYGQVLSAGGLAAGYYTLYAAHFVPALKVIGSPIAAAILLCVWAGGMLVYAAWRQGRVLAVMSIGLAYYSTVVNPSGWISLFSSLVLSAAAMILLIRYRWVWVGAVGLIAAYLAHAFWTSMVDHEVTETVRIVYLTGTWLLFAIAMKVPQAQSIEQPLRRAILGINNTAYWALLVFHIPKLFPHRWLEAESIALQPHEHIGWMSIGLGTLWMLIAALCWWRGQWRRKDAMLWGFQGLFIATLGLMIEASGYSRFLMLAAESCILLLAARWLAPRWMRLAAILCFIAAHGFALFEGLELSGDPAPGWLSYFFASLFGFAFVALMRRDIDSSDTESVEAFYGKRHRLALLAFACVPWAMLIFGAMLRWDVEWSMLGLIGAPLLVATLFWRSQSLGAMDIAAISPFALGFGGLWILNLQPSAPTWACAAGGLMAAAYWLLSETLRQQFNNLQKQAMGSRWIEWIAATVLAVILAFWVSSAQSANEAWIVAGPLIAVSGSVIYVLTGRHSLALLLGLFHIRALGAMIDTDIPVLACIIPTLGLLLHLALLELRFPKEAKGLIRPWAGIGIFFAFFGFLEAADWPETKLWLALSSAAWLAYSFRVQQGASAITGGLLPLFLISLIYVWEDMHGWIAYLTLPLLPIAAVLVAQLKLNAAGKSWVVFRCAGGFVGLILLGIKLSAHVSDVFEGNGQAIAWGLYAVLLFALGLVFADRLLRRFGLFYLTIAVIHVLFIDVMKLDTLGRILSFIVLGGVLLLLGFLYNQYQDKIRRYL